MAATRTTSLPRGGERYDPGDLYDESFSAVGLPREQYVSVFERLAGTDLDATIVGIRRHLLEQGCTFDWGAQREAFPVDLIPRILTPEEWVVLAAGAEQRVQALDMFLHDVYGERRIVAEGVIPQRVITGADYHEPALGRLPEPPVRIGMAGLDIVRTREGHFQVLEDNLRTPSGIAYAMAARNAVLPHLGDGGVPPAPVAFEPCAAEALSRVLRNAGGGGDAVRAVLLSDGPSNSAFWEHRILADLLGIPIVTLDELDLGSVDVVYRRTDEDRLHDAYGALTPVGRALMPGLSDGSVAVINGLGNGVADDKLVHAHVEDMVRFYLHEEPLIHSVPTYDLARPECLEEVLDRMQEMVVKPRAAYGGLGVYVGPIATPEQREHVAEKIRRTPEDYIAQETVYFSTHPTVIGGEIVPRHVDLRAFVTFDGERAQAIPGGLSRVAFEAGELVVNSSQGGGAKDTWVLERSAPSSPEGHA